MTRFYARLNLAEFVGLSAVLAVGFLLVGADAVTVGVATAAALYFHSLFGPITTALALVDDAQAAAASLARLIGVADLPAEAAPARPARPVDASVKTAAAGYSYVDGHPVLRDIDLGVAPGERVALVGASGAGQDDAGQADRRDPPAVDGFGDARRRSRWTSSAPRPPAARSR